MFNQKNIILLFLVFFVVSTLISPVCAADNSTQQEDSSWKWWWPFSEIWNELTNLINTVNDFVNRVKTLEKQMKTVMDNITVLNKFSYYLYTKEDTLEGKLEGINKTQTELSDYFTNRTTTLETQMENALLQLFNLSNRTSTLENQLKSTNENLNNVTTKEENLKKQLDNMSIQNSILQEKVAQQGIAIEYLNNESLKLETEMNIAQLFLKYNITHNPTFIGSWDRNVSPFNPFMLPHDGSNTSISTDNKKNINDADKTLNEDNKNIVGTIYEHAPQLTFLGVLAALVGFIRRRLKNNKRR
jgi:predicted  nucleic acid-binding Zn-ribbon protein